MTETRRSRRRIGGTKGKGHDLPGREAPGDRGRARRRPLHAHGRRQDAARTSTARRSCARVVDAVGEVCAHTIVVTNRPEALADGGPARGRAPSLADEVAYQGPLGGLVTALAAAPRRVGARGRRRHAVARARRRPRAVGRARRRRGRRARDARGPRAAARALPRRGVPARPPARCSRPAAAASSRCSRR